MKEQTFCNMYLESIGSGPRNQILSHVFAHCTSQKTYCHARISCISNTVMLELHAFQARITCFRYDSRMANGHVFFDPHNVQKSVTQIIYLGPLPRGQIIDSDTKLSQEFLYHYQQDNLTQRPQMCTAK